MAFSDATLMFGLGRVQNAEGTELAPAVGVGANANEFLINEKVIPIEMDRRTSKHRFSRPSHTLSKPDPGRVKANVTIPTKLMWRGDPGAGGTPWLDPLFRAGGWKATYSVAGGKNICTYTPRSFGKEAMTFYSWEGAAPGEAGVRTRAMDVKGSWEITYTPEVTPDFVFTGAGKWLGRNEGTAPTPVFPTDTKAILENMNIVIGAGLIDFSPSCDRIVIRSGDVLEELGDLNEDKGYLREHCSGRDNMSVEMRFRELNDLDTDWFDYLTEVQDAASDAEMYDIDFTHGDEAASSIKHHFGAPYLSGLTRSIDKGIRVWTATFTPRNNVDDGEAYIAFQEDNGS